jgi:predicted nuclease with TOPRIM domain
MEFIFNTFLFCCCTGSMLLSVICMVKIQIAIENHKEELENISQDIEDQMKQSDKLDDRLNGRLDLAFDILSDFSEKLHKLSNQLDTLEEIHRSLLNSKENSETAKPIKPNNWDSFREAFRGPTKVEIRDIP